MRTLATKQTVHLKFYFWSERQSVDNIKSVGGGAGPAFRFQGSRDLPLHGFRFGCMMQCVE
ncbi:hypothetical protein SDJN02_03110, partial [Cucurbita argyrosperma subsp. argyrosperma]